MSGTETETLPQSWDPDRDEPFFQLVAPMFPTGFTAGASCLLASYDVDGVVRTVATAQ